MSASFREHVCFWFTVLIQQLRLEAGRQTSRNISSFVSSVSAAAAFGSKWLLGPLPDSLFTAGGFKHLHRSLLNDCVNWQLQSRVKAAGVSVISAGLFFVVPCTDSFIKVDMRTVTFDIPPQEVRCVRMMSTASHIALWSAP